MKSIPHPKPPLSQELGQAIIELGPTATQAHVNAVIAEFRKRRDEEFPGWQETYDEAVKAWANQNGCSV